MNGNEKMQFLLCKAVLTKLDMRKNKKVIFIMVNLAHAACYVWQDIIQHYYYHQSSSIYSILSLLCNDQGLWSIVKIKTPML